MNDISVKKIINLRFNHYKSVKDISDTFGVDEKKVYDILIGADAPTRVLYDIEDVLEDLYYHKELSLAEVSDVLDCSENTIKHRLEEYNIRIDSPGRKGCGHYCIGTQGYPCYQTWSNGDHVKIYVHRLQAVAKYGFDSVKGKVVHHKNGVKWDNRFKNLELLDRAEHASMHARKR